MKKIIWAISVAVFGLASGGVWGIAAGKATSEKEPWFTLLMLSGLAITIGTFSWLGDVPRRVATYTFLGTASVFIAARLLFGKRSSLEMFAGPHIAAIIFLVLWPALERAKQRERELLEQNRRVEWSQPSASFHNSFPGARGYSFS
jgi:hypothetical protein